MTDKSAETTKVVYTLEGNGSTTESIVRRATKDMPFEDFNYIWSCAALDLCCKHIQTTLRSMRDFYRIYDPRLLRDCNWEKYAETVAKTKVMLSENGEGNEMEMEG